MTQSDIGIVGKLKACPFCGHLPLHRQLVNDGRWETSCQTATCIRPGTGIRRREAEAIAAWNTRDPIIPEMVEALEEVRRVLTKTATGRIGGDDMTLPRSMFDSVVRKLDATLAKVRSK